MYQQELARSGHALFQPRGKYIHAVIAIGVVIAYVSRAAGPFADPDANRAWFWLSLGVAVAGALIRVVTNGYAALGTSGRAKQAAEAAELNTTGPYSLVRNPLYVGRIVNFTGIAMLSGSWAYGAITFLVCVLVYERISVYEEEFLAGKFGDEHRRWAAEVPALLPRLHGYLPPKYPFWWRRMLWRENKKFYQLASAVLLYDLAWRGFRPEALPADLSWYYAFGALTLVRIGFSIAKAAGAFRDLK